MNQDVNHRRFKIVCFYALLLTPWIIVGVIGALKPASNSPLDWVDTSFGPRKDYDAFAERFGAADVVVISWPGCRIDNLAVDNFSKALRGSSCFFDDSQQWLFHRVISGRELFEAFSVPTMGLDKEEARERLRNSSLLGPDGFSTAVVVAFNEEGLRQRQRLVPLIRIAATKYARADYSQQHLAGPVMDGYAVDQASHKTMSRFAPLSSILVLCVCIVCLDSLYTAGLVFAISLVSQMIGLAIVYYCGGKMTALLIVIPPLIQVLSIAGGVHLVNYANDAARVAGGQNAIAKALEIAWLPCILSAATTAIGLGSLAVSGLAAVREFGIFAALAVVATVANLLIVLPRFLAFRPTKVVESGAKDRLGFLWRALIRLLTKYSGLVCLITVIGIVVLSIGLSRLQASVRIETLFSGENRLMIDYGWLESHVGQLVPIEAVLTFPTSSGLDTNKKLALTSSIKRTLQQSPHVSAVTSCLDFLPESTATDDLGLAESMYHYGKAFIVEAGYVTTDNSAEYWRLTAHVSAQRNLNYGSVLQEMEASLRHVKQLDHPDQCSIKLSGLMPLVHEIQSQLLRDLFTSFLTAFVLIAIVMTIVQAGFWAGLLSMIPNVFPALALFGFLGWVDHPIDIGSIMTASVAMGIAVDDTLHFLTFFTRRLNGGASRVEAVQAAYEHCGRAMIQTTLICGTGLFIFVLSDFVPTACFAWMMIALLGCAILGDLLILPAILLSPLGVVFERQWAGGDAHAA